MASGQDWRDELARTGRVRFRQQLRYYGLGTVITAGFGALSWRLVDSGSGNGVPFGIVALLVLLLTIRPLIEGPFVVERTSITVARRTILLQEICDVTIYDYRTRGGWDAATLTPGVADVVSDTEGRPGTARARRSARTRRAAPQFWVRVAVGPRTGLAKGTPIGIRQMLKLFIRPGQTKDHAFLPARNGFDPYDMRLWLREMAGLPPA